eukprot:gene8843-1203_t
MAAVVNPKTTHYEFGGVYGSAVMIPGLVFALYFLFFMCNQEKGDCLVSTLPAFDAIPPLDTWISVDATLVVILWFCFQALLYVVLPGQVCQGLPLRDGTRLQYKCNALQAFLVTMVLVPTLHFAGFINLVFLYDSFLQLMTATIVLCLLLSILLYFKARRPGTMLAEGGNTGIVLYDFFIGHELNPRIGSFDLKFFCELRPGLIGWVLITFGMLAKQFELTGAVTKELVIVSAFQTWYVFDAVYSEPAILSTMDICMDGFGFMLVFGDLAWVPFTYSLQSRYLVDFPQTHSLLFILVVIACQLLGYWIFRSANGQKDLFKRDPTHPSVKHLETIETSRGTKLIASGWWGLARHINYFGDLLMALAWCLPCGFGSVIPYFYVIYFTGLLIHRERRDDHKCKHKYGAAWDKYCKSVPYRIVPYIY